MLKDGETKGFWTLTLATPFRGRAIPFHFQRPDKFKEPGAIQSHPKYLNFDWFSTDHL